MQKEKRNPFLESWERVKEKQKTEFVFFFCFVLKNIGKGGDCYGGDGKDGGGVGRRFYFFYGERKGKGREIES